MKKTLILLVLFCLCAGFYRPQARLTNDIFWNDTQVPALSVKFTGTSPPDLVAFDTDFQLYAFDGVNTFEQVYFTVQIPHDWIEGTAIYPHVHFIPAAGLVVGDGTKTVKFVLEYTLASPNGKYDAFAKTTYIMSANLTSLNTNHVEHLIAMNSTPITMTGHTVSNVIICRLYRDPAGSLSATYADTYESDALFLGFDIHYQTDGTGSRQEYVK